MSDTAHFLAKARENHAALAEEVDRLTRNPLRSPENETALSIAKKRKHVVKLTISYYEEILNRETQAPQPETPTAPVAGPTPEPVPTPQAAPQPQPLAA